MAYQFAIDGRQVGVGCKPYLVAELSANHGGDFDRAIAIMRAAQAAGADAVKLQTYTPDTMTIDHDGQDFEVREGTWKGRRLYELYSEAFTPWEWHKRLFSVGKELGITVFSTPFDETAVDLLESLDAPAYKIASFELVDLELIKRVALTAKPTIISTGMGSLDEITSAVETFRESGGRDLILLHCVSGYPAPANQSNLRRIPELAKSFECASGLSDHSLEPEVAIAAVALGACMIEKHLTLRRSDGGVDAGFSMEPAEFSHMVNAVDVAFAALGSGSAERSDVESASMVFRRSLYAVNDIDAGEELTTRNIRAIRPGFGLPPKEMQRVLGKRARHRILRGTALSWDLIA